VIAEIADAPVTLGRLPRERRGVEPVEQLLGRGQDAVQASGERRR
jgi:hypothetical protein